MADIIADAIEAVDADEEKKNASGIVEGETLEKGVNADGRADYETGLMEDGYRMPGTRFNRVDFLCLLF